MANKPKRIRVFAGPNGSGKTTLAENLSKKGHFKLSIFVNADKLEKEIKEKGYFDFSNFKLTIDSGGLKYFMLNKGVSCKKFLSKDLNENISIVNNKFSFKGEINSYIASDLVAYCRGLLLEKGESFIFETVFSHPSKLEFMKYASGLGYKVYFYFVSTDEPEVNVDRVKIRVAEGGHDVPRDKVINRYYRSLDLLYDAIKVSDRAFLFDNSGKSSQLIAEIDKGKGEITNPENVPNWLIKYVLDKSIAS